VSSQWQVGESGARYVDFVWQAVTTTSGFAGFRGNPNYTQILEHVGESQGWAYLELIKDSLIRDICLESEYADTVGTPRVGDFHGRKISPTTLRYGKVLQDLVNAFPELHNLQSIIEVGVGYGGQARLVSEYVRRKGGRLRTYCLVDLLPSLHLSRLYLEHFPLAFEVAYKTKSELAPTCSYDLAISNYAFSEFSRPLQTQYLHLALQRSHGGYLTMNTGLRDTNTFLPTASVDCHSAEELLAVLPNSVVLNEDPKTGGNNYLVIFGQHSVLRPSTLAAIRLESDRAA
jgi:hypothetical protein